MNKPKGNHTPALIPPAEKPKGRPKGSKDKTPRRMVGHLVGLPPQVKERMMPLTGTEQRYVMAYVGKARGNRALAAKLAGVGGNTLNTAVVRAARFMENPKVRLAITTWMEHFALGAAELTAAIADMAEVHLGPFTEWNPKDKTVSVKVPDEETWEAHRHWIKAVEADPDSGRITKLTLHSRLDAMRELAKILKLYSDAPIFQLHMHFQKLTDSEILAQLEEARREVEMGRGAVAGVITSGSVEDIEEAEVVSMDEELEIREEG